MSDWKARIQNLVEDIDRFGDGLRRRLNRFDSANETYAIVPYVGFGTAEKTRLSGRVLENKGALEARATDSGWENLQDFYRRFATDEVAGARVRVRFQTVEGEAVADDEGYFNAELNIAGTVETAELFQPFELELIAPQSGSEPARAVGEVLIPPATARFGIISDLDDTVIVTNVTNRLKMFLTVALLNEHTRLPFKGAAAFYRALRNGGSGAENNPIFYVSSSPWNLYEPLTEFLRVQDIPRGALFLKDFGNHTIFSGSDHASHKTASIELILETYPQLPFVLIGDSGERDPEIYAEIVRRHPNRVRAVYIRSIDTSEARLAAVGRLIKEISRTGCQLVLAPDTVYAAAHAAAENLIVADALPLVREEKTAHENAPSAREVAEEII